MKKKLIENYALCEVLGEGSFGKVYKGVHTVTNQEFAVKVIPVRMFRQNPRLESCSANQIKNLTGIEHNPHIIKFIEMLKTPNNFYFVYQYCNGGTLEARLKEETRMSQTEALKIFGQLLEAFKILNKNNIMHRDLKPDNIFFHDQSVKLGDFGFCKTLMTQDDMTSTMLGSPIYMAPEVLRGEIYTSKADIWSLGVVLYEMIYGHCPFESNSIAKLIAVLDTDELKFPSDVPVSEGTKNLIRKLLIKDQFKRTDWFQLLTMNTIPANKHLISVTQSLSALESEKLSMELRKYNSYRSNDHSVETPITSSQSSKLLKSLGNNNTPQKALTFRKKGDQNTNKLTDSNRLTKTTNLRSPSPFNLESPRDFEPLKKLETNIPTYPPFQRKPSQQPSKRSDLLGTHRSCLAALATAISIMKQGDQGSTILSLVILRRVEELLMRITESIGFGELDLADIVEVASEELRQVLKQIKQLEKELEGRNIDPSQIFSVRSVLRQHHNQGINKSLWYQMICFLTEKKMVCQSDQFEWNAAINDYLMI